MTRTPLVIIGMGGLGREVFEVIEAINDGAREGRPPGFEVIGCLDDREPPAWATQERRLDYLGPVEQLASLSHEVEYVIAVGAGEVRRRVGEWAASIGRRAATLVHPRAAIGRRNVVMGEGTVVCAMVVLTTNIRVGRHVYLNMGATVGHDAVLEDYVTVSPNASISGNVVLEEEVLIGTGAVVIQGRRVGARTTIGAGGAVMHDLPSGVTAVGVPARPFQHRLAPARSE